MPRIKFVRDERLEEALRVLVSKLGLGHIDTKRVFAAWSRGSRTTALARIWGLPSPFVKLGICQPMYIIELVSEKFEHLDCDEIVETIVHELLHIPRSFSGGLRPHGEWSKRKNLKMLMKQISPSTRIRVCNLVRASLSNLHHIS